MNDNDNKVKPVRFPGFGHLSAAEQDIHRAINNPADAPVGPYTGRCKACHSTDVWDDVTWYGCNYCGAAYPQ